MASPARTLLRAAGYLCGSVVLVLGAFLAGTAYYHSTDCSDTESDCFAQLGGMVWGMIAVPLCVVAVVVIELVLWRRRRTDGR